MSIISERFAAFIGENEDSFEFYRGMTEGYEMKCECCCAILNQGEWFESEFGTILCDNGEHTDHMTVSEENSCYFNMHQCEICTDLHADIYESEHGWICEDCAEKKDLIFCDECETFHEKSNTIREPHTHNRHLCHNCASENGFVSCDHCGAFGHVDDYQSDPDGNYLCEDCFNDRCVICDSCSVVLWSNGRSTMIRRRGYNTNSRCHEARDGNYYCDDCFYENFTYCEDCNEWVDNDDACYDEWRGVSVCQSCYNECNQGIHEYGYKPDPDFFGSSDYNRLFPEFARLYTGTETEIGSRRRKDCGSDAYDLTEGAKGLFYCKSDCSIVGREINSGFEVISHPFTLEWFRSSKGQRAFSQLWDMQDQGYEEKASTCGLHVHLSRDAFNGEMHAYRFARFMYDKHNADFMFKMSGRSNRGALNQWASLNAPSGDKLTSDGFKKIRERYNGFNKWPEHTYEVRIFASTLDQEEWTARLEFCYALFLYTYHDDDSSAKDPEYFESFLRWLYGYRETFEALVNQLENDGYPVIKRANIDTRISAFYPNPDQTDLFGYDDSEVEYHDAAAQKDQEETEQDVSDRYYYPLLSWMEAEESRLDETRLAEYREIKREDRAILAQEWEAFWDRLNRSLIFCRDEDTFVALCGEFKRFHVITEYRVTMWLKISEEMNTRTMQNYRLPYVEREMANIRRESARDLSAFWNAWITRTLNEYQSAKDAFARRSEQLELPFFNLDAWIPERMYPYDVNASN